MEIGLGAKQVLLLGRADIPIVCADDDVCIDDEKEVEDCAAGREDRELSLTMLDLDALELPPPPHAASINGKIAQPKILSSARIGNPSLM